MMGFRVVLGGLERCCGIFAIRASLQRTDEEEKIEERKVVINASDERQCELKNYYYYYDTY